jgi:hypothetical protein
LIPEDAFIKYYDIEREAQRADYTIHNGGLPPDCRYASDLMVDNHFPHENGRFQTDPQC